MNMRERLARAIYHANKVRNKPYNLLQTEFQAQYLKKADAVLDELMTPTKEMLSDGVLAYELIGIAGGVINTAEDHLELILQAMVKAAKEGK